MKKQTPMWKTFVHNGPYFPPRFQATGQLNLSPMAEEMLVAWWRQTEERRSDDVFFQNFVHDFNLRTTGSDRLIVNAKMLFVKQGSFKLPPMVKDLTKEQKAERKSEREKIKKKYGFVEVDGQEVPCSFGLEPAGIFIGRGDHPKRGHWKEATLAEDVDLNCTKVPSVPRGHGAQWKSAEPHPGEYWIARWPCPVGIRGYKYLWVSVESSARQSKEEAKYDKAVKLAKIIHKVRAAYLQHENWDLRAAMFLLDYLALRVGDEKGADKADTVGVTTLRCEHVKLVGSVLKLDFLGKDSVRFQGEVQLPALLTMHLKARLANSKRSDLLLPSISNADVNRFLHDQMPGLTAKVFRTYHGTQAVKQYLKAHPAEDPRDWHFPKQCIKANIETARYANLEAAKRLNHKRTLPKNYAERVARAKDDKRVWLEDSADYNLGTSLTNYIDPRVYAAWEPTGSFKAIYSKALQRKFSWAFDPEGGEDAD